MKAVFDGAALIEPTVFDVRLVWSEPFVVEQKILGPISKAPSATKLFLLRRNKLMT
jgi:hypothetical protein